MVHILHRGEKMQNSFFGLLNRRSLWMGISGLLILVSTGCGKTTAPAKLDSSGQPLPKVTLMLNWYPEAEHGGFYAAAVHGIYEQYGLDVEIRPGGPNAPVVQELLTGRIEFAIGNADDVLLFRQEKAPVVALMAPLQNTPRCIMVHADSPANDLTQLAGLTLQANKGRPFLDFMESQGMLQDVRVVPYAGSVANFVADQKTAIQAYSFSEPFLAQQEGASVRCLMLSDVGFNPYASCLIATESTLQEKPDVVQKMVAASRDGWLRYLSDPTETNRKILELNSHGMTKEALEYGATSIRELCLPDGAQPEQFGMMTLDRWQTLLDQFAKLGLADNSVLNAQSVFTIQYLQESASVD